MILKSVFEKLKARYCDSDLYTEEYRQVIEELQEEYNNIPVMPSSASSNWSPAASACSYQMDMSYFDSIEERLGIQEEEFFKKEDFDIEE